MVRYCGGHPGAWDNPRAGRLTGWVSNRSTCSPCLAPNDSRSVGGKSGKRAGMGRSSGRTPGTAFPGPGSPVKSYRSSLGMGLSSSGTGISHKPCMPEP